MKYASIGSGDIGTALARAFARKSVDVGIANTRGPQSLAPLPEELGPNVFPGSVQDAYGAEMIVRLHQPFPSEMFAEAVMHAGAVDC